MKTMFPLATFSIGGLLFVRPAEAREVEYQAPPGCPEGAEVKARIEKAAPEGSAARISVVQDDLLFRGDLVIGAGEGGLKRTVTAKTCNAVVDALTLVVSLYRDQSDAPIETLPSGETPTPYPVAPFEPDVVAREREAREPKSEIGLGIAGAGASWSEGLITGASVFGDLTVKVRWWEPSVRLGLGRTFAHEVGSRGVNLTMTAASLELCPLAIGHGIARTSLCGRGDLGRIEASIEDKTADPNRWSVLGVMLRERVAFGPKTAARPFVEGGLGLVAPLTRHRFHALLETNEVPAVQWTVALAFGVVLP